MYMQSIGMAMTAIRVETVATKTERKANLVVEGEASHFSAIAKKERGDKRPGRRGERTNERRWTVGSLGRRGRIFYRRVDSIARGSKKSAGTGTNGVGAGLGHGLVGLFISRRRVAINLVDNFPRSGSL